MLKNHLGIVPLDLFGFTNITDMFGSVFKRSANGITSDGSSAFCPAYHSYHLSDSVVKLVRRKNSNLTAG